MRSQSTTDLARGYGFGQGENGQAGGSQSAGQSGVTSPNALQNVRDRLEIPGQGGMGGDFATGYSLGLIGGVRSWVSFPLENYKGTVANEDR